MRVVLFKEDAERRIEGEILVAIWGTAMQPLETVVKLNDGRKMRIHFDYNKAGQCFYTFDEASQSNDLLKAWTIYDQNPWDERHHIYTAPSIPLQSEDGQRIDAHLGALIGWVIIDEDGLELQGSPFSNAFGGLTILCKICADTFWAGDYCEHIDAGLLETNLDEDEEPPAPRSWLRTMEDFERLARGSM